MPPNHGAATSYSLMQGARCWVWQRRGWFAWLEHQPPAQAQSKNSEEGGALALGGPQSIQIPNNQLIVDGSSKGDVIVEARWAWSTGIVVPSFPPENWTTKNKI